MDEKRPFAWCLLRDPYGGEVRRLIIDSAGNGGVHIGDVTRDCAPDLNAAVEAREAKLRGALQAAINWLDEAHRVACLGAVLDREAIDDLGKTLHDTHNAIEGHGVAYVPRSQLDEANATIAKMRAAFDALDPSSYGVNGALVAQWLEANGLRKPLTATALDVLKNAPTRPHDPARIRRLTEWWGASAAEAESHIDGRGVVPLWALAEALVDRNIYFDYSRLNRDREYYEAAQACLHQKPQPQEVPGTGWSPIATSLRALPRSR